MRHPSLSAVTPAAAAPLLVLVAACTPDGPAVPDGADDNPYHILVTNDDGVASPGMQELADALRSVGEVTLIAPCGQRSGASMSVELGTPLRVRQFGEADAVDAAPAHCVETTPAQTVLFAMEALAPADGFDLVVSGINAGANTGDFAHMSGTVGAAMAGAYYGVPAVAASLGGRQMDFAYPAAFMARFVEQLRQRPPSPGVVLSVNFPAATEDAITGVAWRRMGGSYIDFGYEEAEPEDGVRVFQPTLVPGGAQPPGSDSEAFMEGMITIAPLHFDWTDEETLREMESWEIDHRLASEAESRE